MRLGYKNRKLTISADLPAPAEQVWTIITDTALWPRWGPSIKGVQCKRRYIELGSKGKVQTAVGIWVPFYISSYEHLEFWGWKVFGAEATGHHIKALGKDQTRLTFLMPWWAAPYLIICSLALWRIRNLIVSPFTFPK